MALLISVLVLSFLQEVFLSLGSGQNPPMISVTEGEPVSFECSFDGSPAVGNPFYEIIWMYEMTHKNVSKRVLAFRMTRPNTSVPVLVTEGYFRGRLEFEKNTSSLIIPKVWVNDSGLYYCEVNTVPLHVKLRTNGTHLIVTASPDAVNVLLISSLTAGLLLFLLALGLYFTLKRRIQAKKPEVSLEMSDPICSTPAPARRESFTQPIGSEMIYSKLQWSKYSMVSSPEGSAHSGEPVTKDPRVGTSDPGVDTVYAMLQAPRMYPLYLV
ncbi:immunoglobulin superfamily member 11-like isoform X1 [Gopherus evgoodei]|uniref:immunoglobulin superfamily member 11-like isoform X1 n=1 Tax=Gopherus evgoodei TaxID=1825980 RepID=UPI0011CFB818|nr:immunoglobulin superfamily member 11-like isoform X1 [Gopherus evgoodei]